MELRSVSGHIWEINKDFHKYAKQSLKDYKFTVGNYRYLLVIKYFKHINLNEISIKLNVDKAMVTRSIKKLLDLGYINKEQDEKDTRSYKLSLTDKGEKTLIELKSLFKDWFLEVTKDFTEEERQQYIQFIEKMYKNRTSRN